MCDTSLVAGGSGRRGVMDRVGLSETAYGVKIGGRRREGFLGNLCERSSKPTANFSRNELE